MSTTFDEYLTTEQAHAEYIDGEVRLNPPSRRHVRMGRFLTIALQEACPPGYEVLPEAGWRIAPRTVLEPDLMVARIDAPSSDILTVPPLLVVEIVSPSSRDMDWGRKRELYLAAGVHYWIVDDGLWVVSGASERLRGVQRLTEPFPVTIDVKALLDL
jgi:Uma2 family endonuclease